MAHPAATPTSSPAATSSSKPTTTTSPRSSATASATPRRSSLHPREPTPSGYAHPADRSPVHPRLPTPGPRLRRWIEPRPRGPSGSPEESPRVIPTNQRLAPGEAATAVPLPEPPGFEVRRNQPGTAPGVYLTTPQSPHALDA